ncbi:MAG: LacI family DNA-binding transcriptional regulator [Gammaproteobacteria bacterium]|nr:LacI family DNA-binding transcriptional regulator [Gammaproteobacteria bacterium]
MARDVVTSQQVAQLAGVSQSAVSRVFSPGGSASPAMTHKVLKVAEELGYRPNVLARSLITGKSKIIGLVVAYLENQFYPEALEKLSLALQAEGYHVLVFMARMTNENADQLLQEMLDYQVDGIVMASVSMSADLARRCHDAGVPVVLFNRRQDDSSLSAVTSDNIDGGKTVARFLIAGGHKKIAHIAGWEGASTQRDRELGFMSELKAHGVALFDRTVGDYHFESAQQAARQMFSKPNKPDAVFVGNDHMALAVMECVRSEYGLRVPGDVSIVGYDDVDLASWPSFSLTTVRQPSDQMVAKTVQIIMNYIHSGKTSAERVEIKGPLVVRESARVPADWSED